MILQGRLELPPPSFLANWQPLSPNLDPNAGDCKAMGPYTAVAESAGATSG